MPLAESPTPARRRYHDAGHPVPHRSSIASAVHPWLRYRPVSAVAEGPETAIAGHEVDEQTGPVRRRRQERRRRRRRQAQPTQVPWHRRQEHRSPPAVRGVRTPCSRVAWGALVEAAVHLLAPQTGLAMSRTHRTSIRNSSRIQNKSRNRRSTPTLPLARWLHAHRAPHLLPQPVPQPVLAVVAVDSTAHGLLAAHLERVQAQQLGLERRWNTSTSCTSSRSNCRTAPPPPRRSREPPPPSCGGVGHWLAGVGSRGVKSRDRFFLVRPSHLWK